MALQKPRTTAGRRKPRATDGSNKPLEVRHAPQGHYTVAYKDGGRLPTMLAGIFTSVKAGKHAIQLYESQKGK